MYDSLQMNRNICICVSWTSWQITPVYFGSIQALPNHILLCHSTSILGYIGGCVSQLLSLWSLSLAFNENFHIAVTQENIQTNQCGEGSACKASPLHVWILVIPSLLLIFFRGRGAVWTNVCKRWDSGNVSWGGIGINISGRKKSQKSQSGSPYSPIKLSDGESAQHIFSLFCLTPVCLSYNLSLLSTHCSVPSHLCMCMAVAVLGQ